MARLKVKQISDFTTAVQSLIDNDNDQSASIISAISTEADAVSTALVNEISATNSDVTTLTTNLGNVSTEANAVSTALVNEISATNGDVTTLTTNLAAVSQSEAAVSASEALVSAALVSEISTTDGEITALQGNIGSIDTELAGLGSSTQITSLESDITDVSTALVNEISATNGDVTTLTTNLAAVSQSEAAVSASEALVSAALVSEIATTDSEISTLQSKVTQLEGDSEYIHDYATMTTGTQFRCNSAMEHASDDDMQVFINGHAIGRVRTVDGTKYGWEHNSNNTTFDLHNIGYDLEAEDVIYVMSHS